MGDRDERDVKQAVVWLRDAASWLEAYGVACLKLAPDTAPLSASMGSAVSGGDRADPTANAVANTALVRAWLELDQVRLRANIGHACENAQAIVSGVGRLRSHFPVAGPQEDPGEADPCRQGCGRRRTPGRQGNCSACAQWLHDNRYPDGTKRLDVPSEVIEERHRREKRKRERVVG